MRQLGLMLLATLFILLIGCKKNDNNDIQFTHVTSVSLAPSSILLGVDDITTLNATIFPENATNKNLTWSSSNNLVAKVNNGVVSGISVGSATITVTTENGRKTGICEVQVVSDIETYLPALILDAFRQMGVTDATFSEWGWDATKPLDYWSRDGIYFSYINDINSDYILQINRSDCEIEGSLCAALFSIPGLVSLNLSNNYLSGCIPPEIGNATNLEYLNLSNNYIDQSIPSEIGNLSNLKNLNLTYNQLSGSIPPEIGNLRYLKWMDLCDNNLSGSIPDAVLENMNFTNWRLIPQNGGYGFNNYPTSTSSTFRKIAGTE